MQCSGLGGQCQCSLLYDVHCIGSECIKMLPDVGMVKAYSQNVLKPENVGKEAVKIWREHFTKVLGANNVGAVGDEEQIDESVDNNNCDTYRLEFSKRLDLSAYLYRWRWSMRWMER